MSPSAPPSPTLSDSALLDSLEDSDFLNLAAQRERKIEALKAEVGRIKEVGESEYGRVVTYGVEKALIERMAKDKFCVVHFFHPDFHRCRIMDQRLDELAPKNTHTLFLRASVIDVPFLVTKFDVKVLPCVLSFVDGRCMDKLIGFEEFGNSDNFTAKALEFRLQHSGVLPSGPLNLSSTLSAIRGGDRSDSDSDDDEARWRGKGNGRAARSGKKGIRDGFGVGGADDD